MPRSPEGFDGEPAPLERQMEGMEPVWQRIAVREGLREPQLDRVASFWHADGDLGRGIECVTDMTKSRLAGFTGDVRTRRLRRVFDRLRAPSTSSPREGGRDQVAIAQTPRGCLDSLTRFQRDRYRELTGSYTEVL